MVAQFAAEPPPLRSQNGAKPEPAAQFRIIVGLTDSAAKPWQGEANASGAALESLAGWRFLQADHAGPGGKFAFRTRTALMGDIITTSARPKLR